jgi:hypothetical protein
MVIWNKAVDWKGTARPGPFYRARSESVGTVRGRLVLTRKTHSRFVGLSEPAIADSESGKPVSEPGLRRNQELDQFGDDSRTSSLRMRSRRGSTLLARQKSPQFDGDRDSDPSLGIASRSGRLLLS